MTIIFAARRVFALFLTAVLLAGCAGQTALPGPLDGTLTPAPTARQATPLATAAPTQPASTPPATAAGILAAGTLTAGTPAAGSTGTPNPSASTAAPSGWTVYANPDYVRGVAVQNRTLWSATLGGVAAWDLDTGLATLYTTRDGLAEIQANAVVDCPAPTERIYVAHSSGLLSVYDVGLKKWSRQVITFDDGSTFRSVSTLFCDAANRRLLAGSPDGLGILDLQTSRWRRIDAAQGLRVSTINAIDVAGQAVWAAAGDKSAYLIQGSNVFPFDSAAGFPSGRVNDLSVAPDASIWLGYSNSLVHYQDKKWTSYGTQSSSGIPFQSIDQVKVGPGNRIWVASAEEGACPFDPLTRFCATVYPGIRGAPITDLVVGSDGVAYLSTEGGGVLVLDGDKVRRLEFRYQQLMSNDVMDITEDAGGRLWVATDRGINLLDPAHPKEPWQTILPERGRLVFPRVAGLLPAADGMWLYYDRQPQVSRVNGPAWLQLDAYKGIADPVLSAAVDQRGLIWFAAAHGIKAWDGSIMRTYTPPDDIVSGNINALLNVGDTMWVGAQRGLLRYQRFQWTRLLPDITINTIAPDAQGGLLLGTDQGLLRFDGSQAFFWLINLGDEIVLNPRVTALARDGSGRLWVGTDGQGLFSYDGDGWERFDTASGLPTNKIRKIFRDHLGAVWIAAVTGEGGGALVRFMP